MYTQDNAILCSTRHRVIIVVNKTQLFHGVPTVVFCSRFMYNRVILMTVLLLFTERTRTPSVADDGRHQSVLRRAVQTRTQRSPIPYASQFLHPIID